MRVFMTARRSIYLLLLMVAHQAVAQNKILHYSTYGDKADTPLIFLHGGPGYNSVVFEKTTAQPLADSGFYVISYDRRGEGRNDSIAAAYTFEESIKDITDILDREKIPTATLLGHSFGGVLATKFAQQHPENTQAIVLVGAPISMSATLTNIVRKSKEIYTEKGDQTNLYYINMLEKMDSASLEYSSYSFMHAMQNGFYSVDEPSKDSQEIYSRLSNDADFKKYASKMGRSAPLGFWKNEQYTTIDISSNLKSLMNINIPYMGYTAQRMDCIALR